MSVDRRRLGRHAVEVRRLAHVGRLRIPVERVAVRGGQVPPAFVALEHVGVVLDEHLLVDRGGDGVRDLLLRRPDVAEKDLFAFLICAERLRLEVEVHGARQRVGDHQRRGGQVVHLDVGGDAALEVAVPREHRGDRQVVVVDGLRDLLGQRSGVADAGGAAVADQEEAQLLQIRPQPGLVVVVADHLRARRHRRLDPRLGRQPLFDGVAGQQRRAEHHRRVGRVGARRDRGDRHRAVVEHELAALVRAHRDRLARPAFGTVGSRHHVDGVVPHVDSVVVGERQRAGIAGGE